MEVKKIAWLTNEEKYTICKDFICWLRSDENPSSGARHSAENILNKYFGVKEIGDYDQKFDYDYLIQDLDDDALRGIRMCPYDDEIVEYNYVLDNWSRIMNEMREKKRKEKEGV